MSPELSAIARAQRGVFRRRQAIASGVAAAEVDALLANGAWTRVRHGIYTAEQYDAAEARRDRRQHLLAAAARRLALKGDMVLSHASAAVWHEIALLHDWPEEPTLTLHRPAAPGRRTAHGFAVAPVPAAHRMPGNMVTNAARSVIDCARTMGRDAALVTVESALWQGLPRDELKQMIQASARWPGVAVAREVVEFASERSETALETLTRRWCHEQGLPPPAQQVAIWDVSGRFVAEADFVWEEQRTVLETDGRKKYRRADGDAGGGQLEPDEVVWREKLREDGIRDAGLEVVRGYWSDGNDRGAALADRLRRAFARGQRATGDPEYRLGPSVRRRRQPLAVTRRTDQLRAG